MSDHVTTLTTDLLVHELKGIRKWDVLGLFLGLGMAEIMKIEQVHRDTPRRRMAMLEKWMRSEDNPSWEMLVEALEKISEQRLADHLRVKYCIQQVTQPGPEIVTQPEPEIVMIKLDRKDAIGRELENFEYKYLELLITAESALENANPSPKQIKRFSRCYMSIEVDTVADLFDQMRSFCFMDYVILEKIISFFLEQDESMISKLDDYIQQLEEFKCSTTVQQFMESIETAQQPLTTSDTPRTRTVILNLVGGWLEKTITDLDKLLKVLFEDKSYVLAHLRIVREGGGGGGGGDFSSKSLLIKTSAGNLMFTSNNVYVIM